MNPVRSIPFPPTWLSSNRAHPRRFSLHGQGQHLSAALDNTNLAGEVVVIGVNPDLSWVPLKELDISLREIRVRSGFPVWLPS